jgi:hypothetical protein
MHALANRLPGILASRDADVTLMQREFVSTYATLEGWTRRPRVLDVDDAVHLKRDGGAAKALARIAGQCDLVIAGNSTLAEWYGPRSRRVEVLATPVDTARYTPAPEPAGPFVVGWMGTAANAASLASIQEPLRRFLEATPGAILRIVSNRPIELGRIPAGRIESVAWTADREEADLRSFHVGLMPLEDTPWNRGKCAFKMLQYMAVGRPVVVSPVGFNNDVLAHGDLGMAPATPAGWADALECLQADAGLRADLGRTGRHVAESHFDTGILAARLATLLRSVAP